MVPAIYYFYIIQVKMPKVLMFIFSTLLLQILFRVSNSFKFQLEADGQPGVLLVTHDANLPSINITQSTKIFEDLCSH